MLENVVFGPFACVFDNDSRQFHWNRMLEEHLVPMLEDNKNYFFHDIKNRMPSYQNKDLQSVILTVGYLKTYTA